MLFAIIKRTNQPIKIVTWFYKEPGILDHVTDESGKLFRPFSLIPIGYKRYRKMVDDATKKETDRAIKLALIAGLDLRPSGLPNDFGK